MSHVTAKTSPTNNKHLSAIPEANIGGHVTGACPKQARVHFCNLDAFLKVPFPHTTFPFFRDTDFLIAV